MPTFTADGAFGRGEAHGRDSFSRRRTAGTSAGDAQFEHHGTTTGIAEITISQSTSRFRDDATRCVVSAFARGRAGDEENILRSMGRRR